MKLSNTEFFKIPLKAIPPVGSKHRQMLDLYMDGSIVKEDTLCDEFKRNFRTILQALRGDRYCHWRFIEILDENGIIDARQLDQRHLSKDFKQDAIARAERRKELKEDSFKEAISGANRVQPSYDEFMEALNSFDELVTADAINIKKPTKG